MRVRRGEVGVGVVVLMVVAALPPGFAMVLVVLNVALKGARFGLIETIVISTGLGAALLGMGLGWIMSAVVVRYANERVDEAMARHTELARELQVERDRLAFALEGSRMPTPELDMNTSEIQPSA